MGLISFHGGHSGQFCDHAPSGALEEVVLSYIAKGFSHIGITEHQARTSEFLYPEEKELKRTGDFLFARFEDYFKEARRLQVKYADRISILVGFETEVCDENAFSLILELKAKHKPDYIVGSLHHVAGIPIDFNKEEYERAVKHTGSIEQLFIAYYEAQYQLVKKLKPEVIGHFDLIRIFAADFKPTTRINDLIKRNILEVISYGGVFEINSRAFKKGFLHPYPSPSILNMLAELGAEVTLGDDSHAADEVGLYYSETKKVVEKFFSELTAFKKDKTGSLKKVKLPIHDVFK